ncbi:DUF2293 domain-containing protein [Roseiconus nitratireducens]|uniref:DUF2293 domain-containing protein n=1 Tax=Roseiconus nitratireducens TaxID=2605748 RepID=A0A5M6DDJ9_9BACT|nr:DUF2293 domain-containing protein [Roseiconus nitratireducens]KAA5543255.1 DUF2293 domain-containing protein [Roseiconus nitratireducens]
MPHKSLNVSPGKTDRQVIDAEGSVRQVPEGWELLAPGDAGLTRRVKAAGPSWTVKEKKGRRVFSRGVWADSRQIAAEREKLDAERSTEQYARRRQQDLRRREVKQDAYVREFESAVVAFLDFDPVHSDLAKQLARAVTAHATPVGSGTVARTERIPVERRAESAVIAWMRHQTTAYDSMKIPRVRGKRREVRRMLAAESKRLLQVYRQGRPVTGTSCPLQNALQQPPA